MSIEIPKPKERKPRKKSKSVQPALFELASPVDPQVVSASPKKARVKRVKKLEDYKLSRPAEIKLFGFSTPEEKKYSNTIELYDFIPKYVWGRVAREHENYLPSLKREVECRGIKYKVIIEPGRVDGKDYYPGKREEIVEAALRKLACDGQGVFLDDQAGIVFSLTALRRELKRMGHTYSIAQIKDALLICTKTNIEIKTEDNKSVLVSGIFESLGMTTWEEWKEQGQQTKCFVRFHTLVTTSIKNGTFRRLNYEKYMSYKSAIARQLYKRLSHHYTQASLMNTYEIMLSTIIRDFGLTIYEHLRDNLQKVKEAIGELKEDETILESRIEKVIDNTGKLIDAKIILRPHVRFAGEMIGANESQKRVKLSLTPPTP